MLNDDEPMDRIGALLEHCFAVLVVEFEQGGWAARFPAVPAPVLVLPNFCGDDELAQVLCIVASSVDWQTPGLSDLLLRLATPLAFGRITRADDQVVVEHNLLRRSATTHEP